MKEITPKMIIKHMEKPTENTQKLKELLGKASITAAAACDKSGNRQITLAVAACLDIMDIKAPE